MVGEGGQPLDTFMQLDDLWIIEGIIRGIERRYRAGWEQARLIVSPHCKSEDVHRLVFPWEQEQYERTDEDRALDTQRALEAARRAFDIDMPAETETL